MQPPPGSVIWVRLEKESFDLAGILISSIEMTLIGIAVSLCLGGIWAAYLITRRRRESQWHPAGHLDLETDTAS